MKSFIKITSIFFLLLSSGFNTNFVYAGSNSIQINLGVDGCNNNGTCELGESELTCPSDCVVVPPPPPATPSIHNYGHPIENISINNLTIQSEFTNAFISWKTNIGTKSTIKWGETMEVKEGTSSSVIFVMDHKMEIINLKAGTMYYFTIESQNANGEISIHPPVYFFTKFLKDTAFPLAPRNIKASADISGITITWQNPPDPNFSYVRIMRHEDRFRGDPFVGKLVYEGTEEKFLDKNVTAGKKYFYVLFARDKKENFSSGVGISIKAYSSKDITPTKPTEEKPIEEKPTEIIPEVFFAETFFVHQYNQIVEPLSRTTKIIIDGDKSTIVDTNIKILPDDWIEIENQNKEIIGQYLFLFNFDSGRYQTVIPPLEKSGIYEIKIYRYKDNLQKIIGNGFLQVEKDISPKIEETTSDIYSNLYQNYGFYVIFLILILILLFFILKRRKKNQQK